MNDLRGDYNLNGVVEQGDLNIILQNWGQEIIINGELEFVEQRELNPVLLSWGQTSVVPEPNSFILTTIVLGMLALCFFTKKLFDKKAKV